MNKNISNVTKVLPVRPFPVVKITNYEINVCLTKLENVMLNKTGYDSINLFKTQHIQYQYKIKYELHRIT